jgi:hypothetical protein
VLLALVPPALVLAAICPKVEPIAFLLIVQVLTVVADTICVNVDTEAGHIVVEPLTIELAAILPQVDTVTIDLVMDPLAFIGASIGPGVQSVPLLFREHVFSVVLCAFRPRFNSLSVLLIIFPGALVSGTLGI